MGLDEQNNMLFKITSYLTWGKKKRTTLIEIKEKQLEGKNAENSISGRRKKKRHFWIFIFPSYNNQ